MKHKLLHKFMAGILTCSLAASCLVPASESSAVQTSTPSRVSVEAPAFVNPGSGTYYLFGSGMSLAKSTDLINWTQVNEDYSSREYWTNDSVYGNILENLSESFRWAGYDDGDYSGNKLNLRAPYIIWNPDYEWKDEDNRKGAYMLYYSVSSTSRRSCIGYAVAKTVEGPYQYVDTIIYSGFTTSGAHDPGTGSSTRNTLWNMDYLNIRKLISDNSISAGLSSYWFDDNGNYNSNYAPNAVDPMVFYDKDGQLKMVYGSGAGGLFLLSLRKSDGSVYYPSVDKTDSASGNIVDRYFGTRISGKNNMTGEGACIVYDEETGYYYLYQSYGNSLGDGGYNMRLFRSENVAGPYVDAAGNKATDSYKNDGQDHDSYGIKLMGNYQFTGQKTGYYSAGNNSTYTDSKGNHFLIYQQRFTGNVYTNQIRVHQQFMNDENWPVTAVYEYRGETIGHYNDSEVTGTYEIIDHGTETTPNLASTKKIELLSDGSVVGDISGKWTKRTGKNYDYINITTGSTSYHGVLFRQYNEETTAKEVMTFSAIGNNNTSLWATRVSAPTQSVINPDNPSSVNSGSSNSTQTSATNTSSVSLKKPSLTVKAGKKKATLTWKKIANATGYQIQYAKNKAMKSAKTIKIKNKKTTKRVIKKLTSKKKYYFRIRAYAKKSGKTVYSKYSAKKKVKIK